MMLLTWCLRVHYSHFISTQTVEGKDLRFTELIYRFDVRHNLNAGVVEPAISKN
jgi:hypothetical protein